MEKIVTAGSQPEKSLATKGFDAFLESIDGKKKVSFMGFCCTAPKYLG